MNLVQNHIGDRADVRINAFLLWEGGASSLQKHGIFDPVAVQRLLLADRRGQIDAAYASLLALLALACVALACWAFALTAVGVGILGGLSAMGGLGGETGRSMMWAPILLPYPAGAILALVTGVSILNEIFRR